MVFTRVPPYLISVTLSREKLGDAEFAPKMAVFSAQQNEGIEGARHLQAE